MKVANHMLDLQEFSSQCNHLGKCYVITLITLLGDSLLTTGILVKMQCS